MTTTTDMAAAAALWVRRSVIAGALIIAAAVAVFWAAPQAAAQPNSSDVIHTTSCLAGNGRVDTMMVNRTASDAVFRLEFAGLTARQNSVVPGDFWRMPITGRPDGSHQIVVKRNGVLLSNQTVEVSCDTEPPALTGPEVQPIVACRGGNGFVVFQFLNGADATTSYVIDFERTPRRSTSAGPFGQALRAVSGRPDGVHTATIRSGSRLVWAGDVRVGCQVNPTIEVPGNIRVETQGIDTSGFPFVGLSWSVNPASSSVEIERDGTIIREDENRAFRDVLRPAREPGDIVTYRIRAVSASGQPSAWSDPLTVVVRAPSQDQVPVPSEFEVTNQGVDTSGRRFVGLAWQTPPGIALVEIERDAEMVHRDANHAYRDVPDPALLPGQVVRYRIRSFSGGVASAWSDYLTVIIE